MGKALYRSELAPEVTMSGQTVTVGAINQVARTTMIWEKNPEDGIELSLLPTRRSPKQDDTYITGTAPPRSDTVFAEHSPYFLLSSRVTFFRREG